MPIFGISKKISLNENVQLVLARGLSVIEIVHMAYTECSRISVKHSKPRHFVSVTRKGLEAAHLYFLAV